MQGRVRGAVGRVEHPEPGRRTGPRPGGHPLVRRRRPPPYLDLYRGGVALALGRPPDLAAAVRAAAEWLDGADLAAIRRAAPFLHVQGWAFEHERAPLGQPELHWRLRLQGLGHGRHPGPDRVLELWRAAFAEPRLRRLYPISSHHNLWFSTGLGPPYESVGLLIVPHSDGTYEVRYHRGSSAVAEALPEPVAVATAAEAVAVAVAALPPQAP